MDHVANLQQEWKSFFVFFLADIPSAAFSRETLHLHTQCISSLTSAHLKDSDIGPSLNFNSRSAAVEYDRITILSVAVLSELHLWLNTAVLTSLAVCKDFEEPVY